MRVFIVYCHPSKDSFTHDVYKSFERGLIEAGHEILVSDLYDMNFKTDMSEEEYLRETYYKAEGTKAKDVLAEQEKIQNSEAIVFIYPVFWTEAPAKLVGWFDRVWTFGFAYGTKRMKLLDKALILATTGNTKEHLENFGLLYSMKKVMLEDRLFEKVKKSDFVVFDGMSRELESRTANWEKHLEEAYNQGKEFFS